MTTKQEIEETLAFIAELYPEVIQQDQQIDTLLSIFNLCEKHQIALADIEDIVAKAVKCPK